MPFLFLMNRLLSMSSENFWISSILKWENQRYESILTNFIYSSLQYRQKYLSFLAGQIPPGSVVIEVGCGTGRLYGTFTNKSQIDYTGYDVSPKAIELANKKFPNAQWHCRDLSTIKGLKADFLISAGLLDWLEPRQLQDFLSLNNFKYHIHSFSQNTGSLVNKIHAFFSFVVSGKNNINYNPRTFLKSEILNDLNSIVDLKFVTNKKLSFGAFVHNLPCNFVTDFNAYQKHQYFLNKKDKMSMIEAFVKKQEFEIVQKNFHNLESNSVIEIGSGSGHYTRWILSQKPLSLVSLDNALDTKLYVDSELFEHSKCSLENYITNRTFDVILALGVLEFSSDPAEFLTKTLNLAHVGSKVGILAPKESGLIFAFYKFFHQTRGVKINSGFEVKLTQALHNSNKKYRIIKKDGGFLNNLFIISRDE